MREGHASRTAMFVAAWRAAADLGLSTVPGFRDPMARSLLEGRSWQLFMARLDALAARPDTDRARRGTLPYLDMIILRVAFIDALIAERPRTQVVILGAGLDTRVYRLESLRAARVFEVDHPATQSYKKSRTAQLPTPLARVSYVPIDFTRATLSDVLPSAGFDPSQPTLWIWEGVIMYLDDAALRGTLRAVRQLSAPGSTLVAHYHVPSPTPIELLTLVRRAVLSWLSEPQIGLRTREVMQRELADAGFTLREDAGLPEQAARVGANAPTLPSVQISRIAVADV